MAHLQVNSDDLPTREALAAALSGLLPGAPVVILIHGFKFDPADPDHDPHAHILALEPRPNCWKALAWPRALHLPDKGGLTLSFGWTARGSIWQAAAEAERVAGALAALVVLIRAVCPTRPVHVVGHSLGASVALKALPMLAPGTIGRLILLNAASFCADARTALRHGAGETVEVLNVTGAENTLFDLLMRAAFPFRGPTLGGGGPDHPRWLDLALHRSATRDGLALIGYPVGPARSVVCHWSAYLRPGIWTLYRALVLTPHLLPLPHLRRATVDSAARTGPRPPAATGVPPLAS